MFPLRCLRRIKAMPNEEGSALMAVLGVMAVAMIVAVAVASATLSSVGFTGATRAGVQAQAAAEAGIDHAEAAIRKSGTCKNEGYSSAQIPSSELPPKFGVVTYYSALEAGDSDWKTGCSSTSAKRIKLKSTGEARDNGAGDYSAGNKRVVEAVYARPAATATTTASGPAVYAYSATGFTGSGTLLPVNGSIPSVLLRNDDVACDGGGFVTGDLVAANGSVNISGSCSVTGSVWASKKVSVSGGSITVGGDVTSGATGIEDSMLLSGARVLGTVWAAGRMTLTWGTVVDGNATAPTLNLAGGNVKGSAWSAGSATFGGGATIDGRLTARFTNSSSSALGGATIVAAGPGAGPAAGPTPVVPNWVDFKYDKSAWSGYTEVAISGACDFVTLKAAAAALASGPGIINALGCNGPLSIAASDKLALGNNLAIFAKGFNLSGSGGFTASVQRKLWLITPDATADAKPTCAAPIGPFTVDGGFTLESTIHAMIYSPCQVNISSGINWYGQVFSGGVKIDGAAKLNYVAVGLPGVDLRTGSVASPVASSGIGARISIRDSNG
jgi:Tfp pilus assembly protein PilX/cytoskeletal protein CcmA (bactofilin family)